MAGPKTRKKLKKKDTNISERVKKGLIEGSDEAIAAMLGTIPGAVDYLPDDKELWMMGDKTYETTAEDRARMTRDPEEAMAGGGKVMRYYNEGGGVYGYFHGGGVDKNQGQYDIQVKKIKKGKIL